MNFCHIKDEYINYLKRFDSKVPDNKDERRPYVGIVLEINEIKYYAPFTSPKAKHLKMKNSKDFRRIKQGELGAINLNNMIPVLDEALIEFVIADVNDVKYRRLLQNQYSYIRDDWDSITKAAEELRSILIKSTDSMTEYEKRLKDRCCDIQTLEANYKAYLNTIEHF